MIGDNTYYLLINSKNFWKFWIDKQLSLSKLKVVHICCLWLLHPLVLQVYFCNQSLLSLHKIYHQFSLFKLFLKSLLCFNEFIIFGFYHFWFSKHLIIGSFSVRSHVLVKFSIFILISIRKRLTGSEPWIFE